MGKYEVISESLTLKPLSLPNLVRNIHNKVFVHIFGVSDLKPLC